MFVLAGLQILDHIFASENTNIAQTAKEKAILTVSFCEISSKDVRDLLTKDLIIVDKEASTGDNVFQGVKDIIIRSREQLLQLSQ